MPIAGEIESQRHSFPDQGQYYVPLPPLLLLPQIISLSFLQLKDICSFFPSPFSLIDGTGRTSKVELGLLITLPANIMCLESPESCDVAGSSKDGSRDCINGLEAYVRRSLSFFMQQKCLEENTRYSGSHSPLNKRRKCFSG